MTESARVTPVPINSLATNHNPRWRAYQKSINNYDAPCISGTAVRPLTGDVKPSRRTSQMPLLKATGTFQNRSRAREGSLESDPAGTAQHCLRPGSLGSFTDLPLYWPEEHKSKVYRIRTVATDRDSTLDVLASVIVAHGRRLTYEHQSPVDSVLKFILFRRGFIPPQGISY